MGMRIGYARVSTDQQSLDPQTDPLTAAGCDRIFSDVMSGGKDNRPGLTDCLNFLREGDTLVVFKLDRLGRSIRHLVTTIDDLQKRGVGFESLQEKIDDSPTGRLLLGVFSTIAEFERALIRERTMAGLRAAKARGRVGGRRHSLDAETIELGQLLAKDPDWSVGRICKRLNISRSTYYRHISTPKSVGV
jgi:DNA invertase Pin-like site-specific DNA recombinase